MHIIYTQLDNSYTIIMLSASFQNALLTSTQTQRKKKGKEMILLQLGSGKKHEIIKINQTYIMYFKNL